MDSVIKIILKWSGKEYEIELNESDNVLDLKKEIEKQTGVRPKRQKLLNLKLKGKTIVKRYVQRKYDRIFSFLF